MEVFVVDKENVDSYLEVVSMYFQVDIIVLLEKMVSIMQVVVSICKVRDKGNIKIELQEEEQEITSFVKVVQINVVSFENKVQKINQEIDESIKSIFDQQVVVPNVNVDLFVFVTKDEVEVDN